MLLLRDPLASTEYSGEWGHDDPNWSEALIAQVPLGIDPTASHTDGIFTIPMSLFSDPDCLTNYQIAHLRDSDGYSNNWYDMEDSDESSRDFFVTVPRDSGPLYFTVETYYQNMIPNECTSGTVDLPNGQ